MSTNSVLEEYDDDVVVVFMKSWLDRLLTIFITSNTAIAIVAGVGAVADGLCVLYDTALFSVYVGV